MKVPAKIAPEDIKGSFLAFEDSPIPFFPKIPEREAWDDLPQGVEKSTIVGGRWPVTNEGIWILSVSAFFSAFEADGVPKRGS